MYFQLLNKGAEGRPGVRRSVNKRTFRPIGGNLHVNELSGAAAGDLSGR